MFHNMSQMEEIMDRRKKIHCRIWSVHTAAVSKTTKPSLNKTFQQSLLSKGEEIFQTVFVPEVKLCRCMKKPFPCCFNPI